MTLSPERRARLEKKRARAARDEQITSQMWKASQVAKKISSFTGLPYEELRDAALEYIVKIYDSWDQSKGANFSTWVNRCLQFHMLNYLRDNSRLVKIPRSYSDLYLKIRKQTIANPDITEQEISDKLQISIKKIRAVRQAFAMTFSPVTEYCNVTDQEFEAEVTMGDFITSHRGLLHKITDLEPEDELFLTDYLVKKRSVSTLTRKNPHLKNADDIKKYSEQLIEFILCDSPYPSKTPSTRKESLRKSGRKSSKEQSVTSL